MTDKPDTPSDIKPTDATFWLEEIQAAKDRNCDWYTKAEEAEERYRDEGQRKFGMLNIFYANVETQKSAIGEDFGKPQVTRVNQPKNDGGLSRHVATIWERATAAAVRDTNDNHDIGLGVHDQFVVALGQVWLELEPDPKTSWIKAPLVYVPYGDFLHGAADRWGAVPWVARAHRFTIDDLVSQCKMSRADAEKVPRNAEMTGERKRKKDTSAKGKDQFKRAMVWEIWAKYPSKSRLYIAEGYDKVLCADPDPYNIKNFFPCPRPFQNGPECRAPITDYSRYEDQAKELDEISSRIFVLTAVMRRRGVHDKKFKELENLALAADNVSLAVDNWAELMAKGGLVGVQFWEDLQPIAIVLAELHKQRRELIELIYELSGISDLARGMTDADETAKAQQLKQQFGSSRFKRREKESRRFAAEAYEIKGELIAEMFSREQLAEMTGMTIPTEKEIAEAKAQLQALQQQMQAVQQQMQMQMQQAAEQAQASGQQPPPPPPPPEPPLDEDAMRQLQEVAGCKFSWEKIAKVLRSDYRRCYSVELDTDQTAFRDETADQASRIQLLDVMERLMQTFGQLIASNPANGDVYKQIMMFTISSFKAGRQVEEEFERAIDGAIKQAQEQASKGPAPDPKAEADKAIADSRVKAAEISLQTAQVNLQKAQIEGQNKGTDLAIDAQKVQIKQVEGAQKVEQTNAQNQAKAVGHQIDLQNKAEQLQFERTERATAREEILKDNHSSEQTRQVKQRAATAPKPKRAA